MTVRAALGPLLCGLLLAGQAAAQGPPPVLPPPPERRVLDETGLLSPADHEALQRTIWSLEEATGAEVGVLVGRTSCGLGDEEYARRVFEAWRIGKAWRDNGVLFLLLVDERAVRILPGTGYESLFDEAAAGRILDEEVIPRLKKAELGAAVRAGVRRVAAEVRRHEKAPPEPPAPGEVAPVVSPSAGPPRKE